MARDRYRQRVYELISEFRKDGCTVCGERAVICLTAHHVNPRTKKFHISNAVWKHFSVDAIKHELKKCVCLCLNCHAKVHGHKDLDLDDDNVE